MKTILAIFNGTRFPTDLTATALKRAKEIDAKILFLFLSDNKVQGHGYGFPSDLDIVETESDADEAMADDDRIIQSNQRIAEDMCKAENIACEVMRIKNPKKEVILEIISQVNLTVIEKSSDNSSYVAKSIELEKIINHSEVPVEWI